jgi:aminoglycoside phosphotransferase (APT) family kinase protein
MGQQWDADNQVTEQEAALLIERQFPDLAPAHLETLGIGWDNVAVLVNGRFVFRFPRRQIAAGLVEREARILPQLAPHLPYPLPVPEYVGTPTTDYPFIFAGYAFLPGQTACRCACTAAERIALAPQLAAFLAALHRIPIGAETRRWAPGDEIARGDLPQRAPQVRERILANVAGLEASAVGRLVDLVGDLATTPAPVEGHCWVHGDFYARHILLDEAHRLAGVIDWGDVHVGEAALDLSIAFSFLPPLARREFRRVYGEIDAATWRRARFRAIHYGTILTEYGAAIGDAAIRTLGEYALRHAPLDE